jgi:DNA-nicking Smr family endonuclease
MARQPTDEERALWQEIANTTRRLKKNRTPTVPQIAAAPASKKSTAVPAVKSPATTARIKKTAVPAAPLEPLARRDSKRVFTRAIEATLDLHGMTQDEAHAALNRFIARAHKNGKRHLAIITGKGSRGEGVLRRNVPRWLDLPELRSQISAISHAAPEKGGEGVLHVLLKKP